MPQLLVTPYRPVGSELLSSLASIGMEQQRMNAARDAQAQSMAANLIRGIVAQRQFDEKLDFDKQQEARMQRQLEIQQAGRAADDRRADANLQLERDKFDLLKQDQERYTGDFGAPSIPATSVPAEGVDLWTAGNPSTPSEGLLQLNATGYHPYDVTNAKERKMEGPPVDAKGNKVYTLEMFQRGEAPYVTVAVPQGSELFGKTLSSPDMPNVPFKAVDHFGTLNGQKIQGPKIDIAVDNRSMASKLTGPMRFTLSDTVAASSPLKPIPADAEPSIPASDAPTQQLRSMAQQLAEIGVTKGEARRILANTIPRLVAPRATTSTAGPRIRRFADGSDRQLNPATGEWEVLEVKPTKDDTAKTARADEDQLMQRIRLERSGLDPLEKKLAQLEKAEKKPEWPWEEGGKYYKIDGSDREEIDKAEFDKLKKAADSSEWARVNHEAEKRRQKLTELETQLNTPATPAPSSSVAGSSAPASSPASQANWKLDPKTGIKWEVGPDGKLTGRHVTKA